MKIKKVFYDHYVGILYYEFCPRKLQTISLVEKILFDTSKLLPVLSSRTDDEDFERDKRRAYVMAKDYIENLFGVTIKNDSIISQWSFNSLLRLLIENARSDEVKSYFGI